MAKKDVSNLDLDLEQEEVKIEVTKKVDTPKEEAPKRRREVQEEPELISCLRNEKVIVRFLPKESGLISNPKHIFYGGMSELAFRKFTVPIIESSGALVNVLTNSEKAFLEDVMDLDKNALSVYRKNDNYWKNYNVRLTKGDNFLDLSIPDDFIKYKVLLANKDFIAPSLEVIQDSPKATYQFVIVNENDEVKASNKELTFSMEAYMILGAIKEEKEKLRFIIETLDGRPVSEKTDLDILQGKVQKLIQANAKLFVGVAKDEYLDSKVLLRECIEFGLIKRKGDFLYIAESGEPMCKHGEDPTIKSASRFINSPKQQQLKLTLEAKLKQVKE